MPRKPNYDFEKRRKEQERAAKKEAKREEKQRRKDAGEPEPADDLTGLGLNEDRNTPHA